MPKTQKNSEQKVTKVDREAKQYNERRRKALANLDVMKMYFMEPYKVNEKIIIYEPTLGQILKFGSDGQYGEKEFYSAVNIFVSNTTSYRLQLWKMGIDWNKISDFELFGRLLPGLNDDVEKILFGDVKIKKMKLYNIKNPQSEQDDSKDSESLVLYDPDTELTMTEEEYKKMANYMRAMFNIFPKTEFAKGRSTKEALIDEERMKLRNKKDESNSMLFPMISACLNHPGFKYRMDELKNLGIVAFMDSVQRLQVYENSTALISGSMTGMADLSKVPKDEFNFMRDMYS